MISKNVTLQYGKKKGEDVIRKTTQTIRGLSIYPEMGPSVESLWDIPSDYRYIYVSRNYIFYKIEQDYIEIINIYNEKEDFIWSLFGIDTIPQETLDYWKE